MKKNYISPDFKVVKINTRASFLTTSYSSTEQASSDATVFGHGNDGDDW